MRRFWSSMPTTIDPAIISALSTHANIDTTNAKISTHGGSGFASTYRITTPSTSIFVKTSTSSGAQIMFEGEHASLNAINTVVNTLCPRSFATGELDNKGFFLATEFLDLSGSRSRAGDTAVSKGSGLTLAQKLAQLHSTPAPIPAGYESPQFGFAVTTCCGETPQRNGFKTSWAEFFAENRMMMILEAAEKNNGRDPSLRGLVETVCTTVVPRLLGDGHLGGSKGVRPVVTHGDLWSGNKGKGCFEGRGDGGAIEDVVFDPSVCYGHNEYDHGIMNMFGGFGSGFWKEYFSILPKTEPAEEYADRVALYESYHHLNHYAMFGGGYKGGAVSLLKPLVKKYGG